jgi:hypothetical protein
MPRIACLVVAVLAAAAGAFVALHWAAVVEASRLTLFLAAGLLGGVLVTRLCAPLADAFIAWAGVALCATLALAGPAVYVAVAIREHGPARSAGVLFVLVSSLALGRHRLRAALGGEPEARREVIGAGVALLCLSPLAA